MTIVVSASCQSNNKASKNNRISKQSKKAKSQMEDLPFSLAKNYFVKNTVISLDKPKITSQEAFDEIFGMATTMGKDGKPSSIDFSKQDVLALVLPETDMQTTLSPISLQKDKNNTLILSYSLKLGQKQSFSTRPNFAIIVDKIETDNIILKQID